MSKTVVEFIKPHRVYTAGDVAGFDPDQAEKLIEAKVAKPHNGKKAKSKGVSVDIKVSADLAKKIKADAKAFDEREADLVKRESAVDAAEANLKDREITLEEAMADFEKSKSGIGKPPAQGSK